MKKTTNLIFFWQKSVEIYRQVFLLLKKDPTLLMLFVITGIIDLLALIFLFLAPFPPVSYILAPIIRTFWSDVFLHYPQNFVLLPKLYNDAHLFIATTAGVFISGLVIKKIEGGMREEKRVTLIEAAQEVFKRYFSILLAWLASYGLFILASKFLIARVPPQVGLRLAATFFLGVTCQSLAAFWIPALLLLDKGFFAKLLTGMRYGMKYFISTSLLIAIPMALVMVLTFFRWLTPHYLDFYPELILWVLVAGCGVMAFVDMWVTLTTTLLFLEVQKERG